MLNNDSQKAVVRVRGTLRHEIPGFQHQNSTNVYEFRTVFAEQRNYGEMVEIC
jgi:hypothetical protein